MRHRLKFVEELFTVSTEIVDKENAHEDLGHNAHKHLPQVSRFTVLDFRDVKTGVDLFVNVDNVGRVRVYDALVLLGEKRVLETVAKEKHEHVVTSRQLLPDPLLSTAISAFDFVVWAFFGEVFVPDLHGGSLDKFVVVVTLCVFEGELFVFSLGPWVRVS